MLLTNEHFLVPEVENSSLSTTHNFYYHFTANDKNRLLKEEITKKDHIRKLWKRIHKVILQDERDKLRQIFKAKEKARKKSKNKSKPKKRGHKWSSSKSHSNKSKDEFSDSEGEAADELSKFTEGKYVTPFNFWYNCPIQGSSCVHTNASLTEW